MVYNILFDSDLLLFNKKKSVAISIISIQHFFTKEKHNFQI